MKLILPAMLLLCGCATQPMVWVRTDGHPMSGDLALTQQFSIDQTICQGEAQKANASGTVIATGGLAGVAAASNRADAVNDVAIGCMAQKGYMRVRADQAAATASSLAATVNQRPKP